MKLQDIRKKTAFDQNQSPSLKAETRAWMHSLFKQYPVAITVTLKQSITVSTPVGSYQRRLARDDCDRIAKRFTQKLNRQVFGKAAERYGKQLKYLIVVEGERSGKNLHLHLAIGDLPSHIKFNMVSDLVMKAKLQVVEIDEQYKVDITDSGWMEYISKEFGAKDTDSVLWALA